MIHQFKVYGRIRGKGRPRVTRNGKHTYTPKETVNWERKIREAYINSGGGHFGNKPLMMIVISRREVPKSRPKNVTEESDTFMPDADNILKAVEDALNKIAYYDDKQIILPIPLKAKRKRDRLEHLEIIISDEIDEELLEAKIKGLL